MATPEHSPDRNGPIHLARCFGHLALMYVQEVINDIKQALDDDAFGPDSPEDAAITSEVWDRREAS